MQRYWDYSERERSELTEEQVKALLSVELMEKGVTKVDKPILANVDEIELPTTEYFEVEYDGQYSAQSTGFVFATAEQAQAFIEAKPIEVASEYPAYKKCAKPVRGCHIKHVQLPTQAAIATYKSQLDAAAGAKSANDKAMQEYEKALKKVSEATSGVWSDWFECGSKARSCQKVIDTRADYLNLCDGNESLADTFLAKAFDAEEIREAFEWFGISTDRAVEAAQAADSF